MRNIPFAILPLLATLTPFALADIEFVSPAAGGTLPYGALSIQWKDSGSSPKLSSLNTYVLELVLGGNEAGADTVGPDWVDRRWRAKVLIRLRCTGRVSHRDGWRLRRRQLGDWQSDGDGCSIH